MNRNYKRRAMNKLHHIEYRIISFQWPTTTSQHPQQLQKIISLLKLLQNFKRYVPDVKGPPLRYEIHLVNHFGKTFRSEFGALKEKLFAHLKKEVPMMFITATCTTDIRVSFQKLLDVEITQQHWPSSSKQANFIQFNIFNTTIEISEKKRSKRH